MSDRILISFVFAFGQRQINALVFETKKSSKRSKLEHMGDALALRDDEGRGKLRKAAGKCKQLLIRRCPNGKTRYIEDVTHSVNPGN